MARMSVRDIRQRWPEAERRLAIDGEVIVTRDSRPVARIVRVVERAPSRRRRFRADEHLRWLRAFWRGKRVGPSTDEMLRRDCAELAAAGQGMSLYLDTSCLLKLMFP